MAQDVGTLRLIDYQVPVANTGIIFVAALSGVVNPDGTVSIEPVQIEWAIHRAASQLAFMGLIRGDTFAFLRESVPMTVNDAATLVGYAPGDVVSWEDGSEDVPFMAWQAMGDFCCTLDHRPGITVTPLQPNFRPRILRIVPDIPMDSKLPPVVVPYLC